MAEVAQNWKYLLTATTETVASLSKIDAATEAAPRAALLPIRQQVGKIMQRVKAGNLSRVGQMQIARDVAYVFNSLNSVDAALATKAMTRARMGEVVATALQKMDALRKGIQVHVDHKVLQVNMSKAGGKGKSVTANAKTQDELEWAARRATSFSSFSDAMKEVMGHINEVERRTEDEGPSSAVVATAMTEVRERYLFQAIGSEYDDDLREARQKLAQFRPNENSLFTFLRLPVVVISSRQIPTRNLDAAGIQYKVIPFPGIQQGASPGGRHEQSDTHGVILSSQLVVAIPNKLGTSTSPEKRQQAPTPAAPMGATRTRGTGAPPPPARKVQSNQVVAGMVDMELTRQQIPDILKQRTGKTYVDVLGTSGARTKFLVSRQLPGFRFIWLLRQDQYSKMGSLNMREVGLPFKGGL